MPSIIGDVNVIYENNFRGKLTEPHYLLGVYYDGKIGRAVLEFVDETGSRFIRIVDPVGHYPYFLTDEDEESLKAKRVLNHPAFHAVELVSKINPLTMEKTTLRKVVVKDPLAVRSLRTKVSNAWEAKIKYHANYIFDYGLIPGMRYVVETNGGEGRIILIKPEIPPEVLADFRAAFQLGQQESDRMAEDLLLLFEELPPKAKRISIDIEVYTPVRGRVPSPRIAEYPIVSVALVSNDGLRKVLVLARNFNHRFDFMGEEYPPDAEVEFFDSEVALILETLRILSKYPVVISFNGDNFDLTYIYVRAIRLGIPRSMVPIEITQNMARLETGLHLDLYKFFSNRAVKNYAFGGKYQEEKLDAISSALLGISKIGIEEGVGDLSASLLIAYNFRDAEITLKLTDFNNELVWKLITLLARVAKTSYEEICRKQISYWIQNLFFWEHRRLGYLIPNKEDIQKFAKTASTKAVIEGKKYAGALVIEPPMGVFFDVVVLDIASLYPSIIKRYNLSYETVDTNWCNNKIGVFDERDRQIHSVCVDKQGLTAQVVGLLRDFRVKIYKKRSKAKNLPSDLLAWYDVVQRAIKVFINASYGVFGDARFSLYSPAVAESVTALGRKNFLSIVIKASQLGVKVLYGDTDSIFVWAPSDKQLVSLQDWVAKNLGLEIEIDKKFTYVIFTGKKKNYLGRTTGGEVDVKGLIAKKRNAPEFLKHLFNDIIEYLKKTNTPEDFMEFINWLEKQIKEYYEGLLHKEIPLDELAIKTALTKSLNEYVKNTPQHVKAALVLAKEYGVAVQVGDIISYVMVAGRDGVKPVQVAKLSEIEPKKYIERVKSGLEQLLAAINIKWEDIIGASRASGTLFSHTPRRSK